MDTIQQDKTDETGDDYSPVMTASEFAAANRQLPVQFTTKKALYYNFFPSQEQEDPIKVHLPPSLVEIRDVYAPAPPISNHSPWTIKKKLNYQEVATGNLVLRYKDVFEHVLRHWHTVVAELFVIDGVCVSVPLLDLTEENKHVRENKDVFFYMLDTRDCVMACSELIRNLKANADVFLYWDAKNMRFCFRS